METFPQNIRDGVKKYAAATLQFFEDEDKIDELNETIRQLNKLLLTEGYSDWTPNDVLSFLYLKELENADNRSCEV